MSCEQVREQISLMLDGQLTSPEWEKSRAHLRTCRQCDAHFEFLQDLRADMRSMASPPVPAGLSALRLTDQEHGLLRSSIGRPCEPCDPMRPMRLASDLKRTRFGRHRLSHGAHFIAVFRRKLQN